ncbi:MAG: hypothetical protein RJB66_209 [Pseudomonadota bacterium]|jgi:alpha-tubulin suppressor-like RCC1 family protein
MLKKQGFVFNCVYLILLTLTLGCEFSASVDTPSLKIISTTLTSTESNYTNRGEIPLTVTFSENIEGFESSDIKVTLGGGQLNHFTKVSDSVYTFELVPVIEGKQTVVVSGDAATNPLNDTNSASNEFSIQYDITGPAAPICLASGFPENTLQESPTLLLTPGSDAISGWARNEIQLIQFTDNSVVQDWTSFQSGSRLTGLSLSNGTQYFFKIRSIDRAGNVGAEATCSAWTAQVAPVTATLSAGISNGSSTNQSSLPITVVFNFAVTGFELSDLNLTNATASQLTGSGHTYQFILNANNQGTFGVNLPAGSTQDSKGNLNLISNTLNFSLDSSVPVAVLSGVPTGSNSITFLDVSVGNNNGLTKYKYKVGASTNTDCSSADGYSAAINQNSKIAHDLSGLPDAVIRLCVVGGDASNNWQAYQGATEATWTKSQGDTSGVATLSNLPVDFTPINIIVGGTGITHYRYKVGTSATTDCNLFTGYGAETAVGIAIEEDLSSFADGTVLKFCVLGSKGGNNSNYQLMANATNFTWTKDSVVEASVNSSGETFQDTAQANSFQITLGEIKPYDVTLSYKIFGGAGGDDHNLVSNSVTIPAGQLSSIVNYHIVRNSAITGDKIFNLRIDQSSRAGVVPGFSAFQFNVIQDTDSNAVDTIFSKIDAGAQHTCGITFGGKLKCWGDNGWGQLGDGTTTNKTAPITIDSGTSYNQISAGSSHTCGITTGGALKCWGDNGGGQLGDGTTTNKTNPTTIDSGTSYNQISAGGSHTCGITTGGALKCWGRNVENQLGDGTTTNKTTPTTIDSGTSYSQISAGGSHTCGITTDDSLKCWGWNGESQLGDGSTNVQISAPSPIDSGTSYAKVFAKSIHTCGITTGGTLKCWGRNTSGQLGDPTINSTNTPLTIDTSNSYAQIAAGFSHTCGITTGGTLRCWGDNSWGQVGHQSPGTKIDLPTIIDGGKTYSQITADNQHTCGLTTGGTLKCWGSNDLGQLGDDHPSMSLTPRVIQNEVNTSQLSATQNRTCRIVSDSKIRCSGVNDRGQLGDGTLIDRHYFSDLITTDAYSKIHTGRYHTCAITTGGALKCWGWNGIGQLGDGTTTNKTTPITIDSGTSYNQISVGGSHTCGITSGGALKCWGLNNSGQVGDGTTTNKTSPTTIDSGTLYSLVSAGISHTCAITTGSVLKCWGGNTYGELGDDTNNNKSAPTTIDSGTFYSQVVTGHNYTCGITNSGALKCWGRNENGELGNNPSLSSKIPTVIDSNTLYAKIAVGGTNNTPTPKHTCGITTGGALKCWGSNNKGQLGDGTVESKSTPTLIDGTITYAQVSAGYQHTCGITTGGALKCWGDSGRGQFGDPDSIPPWLPHPIVIPP